MMHNSTVADVMTTRVLTAHPSMPLKELARVLAEHRISALPVLDTDDRLIGVVSERDLLVGRAHPNSRRAHAEIAQAAGDTVGEIMTRSPITIAADAGLAEAARLMTGNRVKRLPVLDRDGSLVGVISRGDLVRSFLRSDADIRRAVINDVLVEGMWADHAGVDVSVEEGVVTLTGTVHRRSFAEVAERLVRRMDGVVDVVNALSHGFDDLGDGDRRDGAARARS
jgi:CBS domain-containing protein